MGLTYNTYLTSTTRIYGCRECKTHFAIHEDIISRVSSPELESLMEYRWYTLTEEQQRLRHPDQNFRGQHGKAFLFDNVVNVVEGEAADRTMTTGKHTVRDITCRQCTATVGWKYDKAYEPSEKYKEGKYILEGELLAQVQ